MKDENKKSMKDYIKCYSAVLILVLVFLMLGVSLWVTYARYQTTVDSQLSIDVASLIIETKIDTIDGNLARGKNVTRYFTIQNFNDTETTEIAYE